MVDILTVTVNPSVDISTSIEDLVPRAKLRCTQPRYDPGGGGLNVTRAAMRLGATSQAIVCAGGAPGKSLLELLAREQVEPATVGIDGDTRENMVVFVESKGQYFRFVMPGPCLSETEFGYLLKQIETLCVHVPYVVASGSLPPGAPLDAYAQIARIVRQAGGRLVVDTSGEALAGTFLEPIFMFKPNLAELKRLLNLPNEDKRPAGELALEVTRRGLCEVVVVSLGESGALVAWNGETMSITPPQVKARSTVGAGDSLVAGLVVGLSRGWQIEDAVAYGVAAGTAAVLAEGTGLCGRADTEKIYQQVERRSL